MKSIKKVQLLTLLCLAFQSIYASQDLSSPQGNGSEMDIEQTILQIPEYQGYLKINQLYQGENDAFDYTKRLSNKDNDSSILFEQTPYKVEFEAKDNLFNSGKTITITVRYVYDGKLWTQSEQWSSKNSSYLTWTNAALAATAFGAAGAGAYLLSNMKNDYIQQESEADLRYKQTAEAKEALRSIGRDFMGQEGRTSMIGHVLGGGTGTAVGAVTGMTVGGIAGTPGRIAGGIVGGGLGSAGGAQLAAAVEGKEARHSNAENFGVGAGIVGGMLAGTQLGSLVGPKVATVGSYVGGIAGAVAGGDIAKTITDDTTIQVVPAQ